MNAKKSAMNKVIKKLSAVRVTLPSDERKAFDRIVAAKDTEESKGGDVEAHLLKEKVAGKVAGKAAPKVASKTAAKNAPKTFPQDDEVSAHLLKEKVAGKVAGKAAPKVAS